MRAGGGLDVYVTPHVALSAEFTYVWTGATGNEHRDYVSVTYGLLFGF